MAVKPGYVLIDKYCKAYEKKYGSKPVMNRFKRQWGFTDMATDLGLKESEEIIEYFFSIHRRPPRVEDLLNNYENLKELRDAEIVDLEHRRAVRERTRKMVQDWEDKDGQQL